jgi:hypothetical protein
MLVLVAVDQRIIRFDGAIGPAAAIANAVNDAMRTLGAELCESPISPPAPSRRCPRRGAGFERAGVSWRAPGRRHHDLRDATSPGRSA